MQKAHASQRDEIILFCVLRASYSGNTSVSKTDNVGSIPTARAAKNIAKLRLIGASFLVLLAGYF